jgi:NAD(P)-dependent dehydrogenase (short-subunit alcohol dehydrogenase family)
MKRWVFIFCRLTLQRLTRSWFRISRYGHDQRLITGGNLMQQERKAIFITGAASGMGRATARLFARKGWLVGCYDVNSEGLDALREELGDDACIMEVLDVSRRDDFRGCLERFSARSGGRLDLLYNNAGILGGGMFVDMEFEMVEKVINTNLWGTINGMYEAMDLLKATPNALCFTTSSASAIFGAAGLSIYTATKHAVKGLTEALSVELSMHDIRVADVLPGLIDTGMMPEDYKEFLAKEGMWRLMPAEAVAEVVWAAYHDTRLHWYVPAELEMHERVVIDNVENMRDINIKETFGG